MVYNRFMRIGIDIRNIGRKRTGDEVVFLNLVRELSVIDTVNEYRLFIDTRTDGELEHIADRLGISGKSQFQFVRLPAKNKFDWNAVYAPRAIAEESLDVYHTQYITPFFVSRRTRIVTHIHDVSFKAFPQLISPIDRMFLSLLLPSSLRRADGIVAVSEFTKSEILKYYSFVSPEKVAVVPNAVDPEFASRASEGGLQRARSKYSLPDTYILYVGTLQPRKNVPFLLESFARVREQLPEMSLVLVGNRRGHHVDPRINGVVTALGLESSVVFPGFIDAEDLPSVMWGATAFVYPSLYEGFGIPALEAMSVGVPVLASDIPPFREACGDAVMFSDPTNIAAFSDSLYTVSTLKESARAALIQKGIDRSGVFSWKRSAKILLSNVYEGR